MLGLSRHVLTAITLAAGLAALAIQPAPVPPAPVPTIAFRTRLVVGDSDRNWTYISAADGNLSLVWHVNGKPYQPWPLPAVDATWEAGYHGGFVIADNQPAGNIVLDCSHGPPVQIQVVVSPTRTNLTYPAGTSPASIQADIDKLTKAGKVPDITLLAGPHTWNQMVTLPANAVVRGFNATIRRLPLNNYGGNWPIFYVGGQDVSVYGLTFVNDQPGGMVFAANPSQSGVVVADCIFRRCNLGFYLTASLVRDCRFESGGAIISPSGLFWRCCFLGPSVIDPWQFWYLGKDNTAQMIDCTFDKTCRGPVFNALGQSINDPLFCGVECHGVVRGNNGDECWLVEGGPVNRLIAFHCRTVGCDSASFQFDGGSTDCYIRDFVQDGGAGVSVNPWLKGATSTNFVLDDFELRRCGVYCGPGASGCSFTSGTIIGYLPTRGNQTWRNPAPLCDSRRIAAWAEGPQAATNTLSNVDVIGLPAGFTGVQGFAVQP